MLSQTLGGRQSLGAVIAIRLGLSQPGSIESHRRLGSLGGSNDGCRRLQPLEFGHFPMTAERSNRIAQVL
jgi:hypothetical protein